MNALKLGQKLCSVNHITEDITTKKTPRNNEWSEHDWNIDYRTNREEVVDTGTAPCKTNCPAHIAVQGYIKLAAQGKYDEALELIKQENPFPAVCGHVCNRACEDVCTRGDIDEPIAIDDIKKFIADRELKKENRFIPKKRHDYSDKKIAVVGSGPAGLSCAYFLALDGYSVTVFEKESRIGGMLTMGIPSFVLEKNIVDAEIDVLRELGVEFRTGIEVGKDITLNDLRSEGYSAFYLAVGDQLGRKIGLPGEEAKGVLSGIEFLKGVNLGVGQPVSGKVVVIGGGNVAIDIARVAVRQDATKVEMYCLEKREEMPALSEEIETAEDEGVSIHNSFGIKSIITEDGKVRGVELMRCIRVFDDQSRFAPRYNENDTVNIDADYVLLAIGQDISWSGMLEDSAVSVDKSNRIPVDSLTWQSDEPDIFAGGDAVTGPSFAIDAIAAGKQGAISIHRFVQPGQDLRFGRSPRVFKELDRSSAVIENYDNTPRQRAEHTGGTDSKKTFEKLNNDLTEEQIMKETERCLGCGATIVDEYMCVGCGMCVTKCKFDAISLERIYDGKGVEFLKIKKSIAPHVIKRKIKIAAGKILGRN
jgi:NADPH-dependent glutamate synthase beta subunit-like oxidoreductase